MRVADVSIALEQEVRRFLAWEAYCLDRKLWDDWLALFSDEAEYWAPAWASEEEVTNDPGRELSLIYLRGKGGIEDRIFRIRARDSLASVPLDRTAHILTEPVITKVEAHQIEAGCSWITHVYSQRGIATLGGYTDYLFHRDPDGLKISRKRVVLIDDRLDLPVDVYHL